MKKKVAGVGRWVVQEYVDGVRVPWTCPSYARHIEAANAAREARKAASEDRRFVREFIVMHVR